MRTLHSRRILSTYISDLQRQARREFFWRVCMGVCAALAMLALIR